MYHKVTGARIRDKQVVGFITDERMLDRMQALQHRMKGITTMMMISGKKPHEVEELDQVKALKQEHKDMWDAICHALKLDPDEDFSLDASTGVVFQRFEDEEMNEAEDFAQHIRALAEAAAEDVEDDEEAPDCEDCPVKHVCPGYEEMGDEGNGIH